MLLREETCRNVEFEKPNDVLCLLFENVNSLGMFSIDRARCQKLKQMRLLLKKLGVGMASFVETQVDWRHISRGQQFDNLFAHGLGRHRVAVYTATVGKTYSPRI